MQAPNNIKINNTVENNPLEKSPSRKINCTKNKWKIKNKNIPIIILKLLLLILNPKRIVLVKNSMDKKNTVPDKKELAFNQC